MTPRGLRIVIYLLLLCSCMVPTMLKAQMSCVPVYTREYTAAGHIEPQAMSLLPDGSYIIAGRGTVDATSPYDGLIMKISNDGTVLWSTLLGGAADDVFTGICPLNDGGYILYGITSSYGHPEGKTWLVRITAAGAVIWSRQLGSGVTGTDRPKAIHQFTDGDIVGTFTVNDSTASSDPVVFKMGADGTLRWMQRFDNNNSESFTSIAFSGTTIYASGFYTTSVRRAVMVQLNSGNGSLVSSTTLYQRDLTFNEEIAGLEIFNNIISFGLVSSNIDPSVWDYGLLLTQTDLQHNVQYAREGYISGSASGNKTPQIRRSNDEGFLVLYSAKSDYGMPVLFKVNRYGTTQWGNRLSELYEAFINNAWDITPDGGCVLAGNYGTFFTNFVNKMRVSRITATGETAGCNYGNVGMFTDTATYKEAPFTWASQTAFNPVVDDPVTNAAQLQTYTATTLCDTSYCTDRTPLPPVCNRTNRIEYSSDQPILFRDITGTTDGGRVGVGSRLNDAVAVKFKVNGDVEWAKTYQIFYHDMKFMRIMRTSDNNLLVFANSAGVLNHGAFNGITLLKLDINGNILWSHDFVGFFNASLGDIGDICLTPDDGFIMVANRGWGSGGIYSYVVRCDANANIIWQKELKHNAAVPVYKSVTCDNAAVYLAYDSYDYYNYPNFGVDKLELSTGNKIWTNRYNTGATNFTRINRVFAIQDTVYAFINNFIPTDPFYSLQNTLMVKLNPDGNINRVLAIETGSVVPSSLFDYLDASPPTVTLSPDVDFVLVNRIRVATDTVLNISRFDRDANMRWSRTYPNLRGYFPYNIHPQASGFLMVGSATAPRNGKSWFTNGFMLKVDSLGLVVPDVSGDCAPDASITGNSIFSVSSATIIPHWQAIDSVVNMTEFSFQPVSVLSQDVDVDATLLCNDQANCQPVSVGMDGNTCALNDTLVYFLQNAVNCEAAATWKYDTSFFKTGIINGDSIQLIPVKTGASSIRATIEGNCFLRIQNLPVAVLLSANSMSLGKDTMICPGNSITLDAGPGYTSYTWSDNSTDQTLIVNAPGKYYVRVQDNCGGSATDTVIVTAAGASFQASEDTSKCNQDMITLRASSNLTNYRWHTGNAILSQTNTVTVNPLVSTKYYVSADLRPGCRVIDSVFVTALSSPDIHLQADTSICTGDSVTLQATPGFNSYAWNTGQTGAAIIAKNKGRYSVTATYTNGCISKDSFDLVSLYTNPQPALDKNPVICTGSSRTLSTSQQYSQYTWSDGSTGPSITVQTTGLYKITVKDQHGCTGSDSVAITTIAPLPSGFLDAAAEICQYGTLKIVPLKPYQTYQWSDFSNSTSLTVNKPGTYWLQVTDANNCSGSDTIQVAQKECLVGFYVPNAFTPGTTARRNDIFRPMIFGNVLKYEFTIFNRWGGRVYASTMPGEGWDGNIKGQPASSGTYVWYCRYTLEGQPVKMEKGIVMLIR